MGRYRITGPDGASYEVTAPDGASEADVMAYVQQSAGQPDDSAARGFGLGALKPLDNLARGVANIPGVGPALDRASQAMGMPTAEQAYQDNQQARANNTRTGAQFAGNVAGILPTAVLPGGALAQGAAGGALLSDADTAGGVAMDAGIGAAGARVAQGALQGIGKAIAPTVDKGVRALADAGIPLTPGQAFGGVARSIEDRLTGLPVVGDVVNNARGRGVEAFNRTVLNKVLGNIGKKLPKDVQVGRDAVAFVADEVSGAYQKLLPSLQVKADKPFQTALSRIEKAASSLPGDGGRNFVGVVGDDVLEALRKGGTLSGEGLKTLESRLSGMTSKLRSSPDAYQKMLGETVGELLDEVRAATMRSNPSKAVELKTINKAFAELVRAERAAGAAGNATGVFTPKAYQAAVRAGDSSSRKAAFAKGRALNQELSDAAADILPNRVPDSGTAGRAALAGIGGFAAGGGAAALGSPGLMAAGALASLPYTQTGQRALSAMLRQPGPVRGMIGRGFDYAGSKVPVAVPALLARN